MPLGSIHLPGRGAGELGEVRVQCNKVMRERMCGRYLSGKLRNLRPPVNYASAASGNGMPRRGLFARKVAARRVRGGALKVGGAHAATRVHTNEGWRIAGRKSCVARATPNPALTRPHAPTGH